MKKYQNFVEELERIKKEEKSVKEQFMKEFLSDVEKELIKLGAVIEENIDPNSLNVRDKDTKGVFSTIKENIKIYWIHKKLYGWYIIPYELSAQIWEFDMENNKRKFDLCMDINPNRINFNGKPYFGYEGMKQVIRYVFDFKKKKAIDKEYKQDLKNFNLY